MIESKQNEKIKLINKLKIKKYRDKLGLFLVFGDDLIGIAREFGLVVEVFSTVNSENSTLISKKLMHFINEETDYHNFAICKKPLTADTYSDFVLALDHLQDPRNLGALFRSAAAFGFTTVLISLDCCDIYHEHVLRASKGALFYLNVKRANLSNELIKLKNNGFQIVSTHQSGTKIVEKQAKIVLILGNEGNGINQDIITMSDLCVAIPTKKVESLNVAVAGSILMYEISK